MTYSYPGNITGLGDLFIYVSNETSGLFPLFIVIVMFIIAFVSVKIGGLETSKSFAFASFISFVISSIAWAGGFIPGKVIVVLLTFVVISFIWLYVEKD